jgi:hypothetical protein
MQTTANADLRAQICSGHARPEQKAAVCSSSVPLAGEDRVELLTVLASDPDETIAERAKNVLFTQVAGDFLTACGRPDASDHLFAYCAANLAGTPGIADALARNPACPTAYVTRVATSLTPAGIQALLDNMERLISDAELLTAIATSTSPNAEQKDLLSELHKTASSVPDFEAGAEEAEPDPVKRKTLMQQVAGMNVVQRLTLALKGGRTERLLLIRDPNKLVQRCVLQSPRLTDTEVEAFASMSNLSGEILRTISLTRIFMKNYTVVKNLTSNPKTPLDVSLHLFPRLTATDLVKLTANKNVPETLRSAAIKLHRKRKLGQSG